MSTLSHDDGGHESHGDAHGGGHGEHGTVKQEKDTTALGFLLWSAVGVAVSTVICIYLSMWLTDATEVGLGKLAPTPPAVPGTYEAAGQAGILERGLLVERRGQKADGEFQKLRLSQQEELNSYGWVDRPHGLIHIPISQAMDQVVSTYGQGK